MTRLTSLDESPILGEAKSEFPMPAKKDAHETTRPSRLYRSETNRVIAGVAGGLAEYFGIDPTIVRVLFVLMSIWGGSGVLIYLLLWIIIPSESDVHEVSKGHTAKNVEEIKGKAKVMADEIRAKGTGEESRMWLGLVVLGVGLFFLLQTSALSDRLTSVGSGRFF